MDFAQLAHGASRELCLVTSVPLWIAVARRKTRSQHRGKPVYVQTSADALLCMSKHERRSYAYGLLLFLRFVNGHIREGLPEATLRKAGMSRSQLRRAIAIASRDHHVDGRGLKPMVGRYDPEHRKMVDGRKADRPLCKHKGWVVVKEHKHMDAILKDCIKGGRRREKLPRCTMILYRDSTYDEIMREMRLKMQEHFIDQVKYAAQAKKDKGVGAEGNRQELSTVGLRAFPKPMELQESIHPYEEHPSIKEQLDPVATKHQAPLPSKAFSAKMGVSRSTWFADQVHFEESLRIKRTKRRLKVGAVADPQAFHRKYGMFPFEVGGLWYAQASNLYQSLTDYRGPNAEHRKRFFGRRTKDISRNH